MDEALNRLIDKLEAVQPDLTELALRTAQMDAAGDVMANLIGTGVGVGLLTFIPRFFRMATSRDSRDAEALTGILGSVVFGLLGAILVIACAVGAMDLVKWFAAFGDPAPYLLRSLL